MNADAKFDSLGFRHIDIAVCHAALNLDGATYRIDGAGEFDQHPVAGSLDDTAAMFGDFWVDKYPATRFQPGQRAFFIAVHQAAIAGNAAARIAARRRSTRAAVISLVPWWGTSVRLRERVYAERAAAISPPFPN